MKKKARKTAPKIPKILLRDKLTSAMARTAKDVIRTMQEKTGKRKVIKKLLVKEWLLRGLTLTARQCSRLFGADRLSDIIFKLRGEGMNIESPEHPGTDRFGNPVEFSVYKWLGETPKIGFAHVSKTNKKTKVYSFIHRYPMHGQRIRSFIQQYCEKKLKCRVKRMGFLKKPSNHFLVNTSAGTKLFIIHFMEK